MNDPILHTIEDKNFHEERELDADSVIKESLTVQTNN
jgi:hypothetical protein